MKKTKNKKPEQYTNDSLVESFRGILGGVGNQTADLGKSVVNLDDWDEYLGIEDEKEKKKKHAGDLTEGEELNLKDLKKENSKPSKVKYRMVPDEQKAEIEPAINYYRETVHVGERAAARENRELDAQLREIAIEIKKLTDNSKELQSQFKEIAIEQHVVSPGKYHKSFFTWILSIIQIARKNVEDSGAWLAAMQSKKKQRQYGAMARKYNTSFTLNNERTVATQVG